MMPKSSLRAPSARRLTALLAVTLLTASACSSDGGGVKGGTNVTVVGIVTIPNLQPITNLVPATTRQFLGVPTNEAGNWVDKPVTWSTSNAAVATVSATGLVTAIAGGTTYIRASAGGKTDSVAFLVRYPVGSITLAPATVTLNREGAQALTTTTIDTQGATVTGRTVTYTTSDAAVATVSATGVISASAVAADGSTATITATAANALDGGVAAVATRLVTVTGDAVVQTVTITGGSGLRGNTGQVQLTGTARSGLGNVIGSAVLTWTTNNASVGTVDNTGLVTMAGNSDTLRITATATGQGAAGGSPAGVAGFRVVPQLANGVAVVVPTVAAAGFADYTVLGTGLANFTVAIGGGSGDADLYLYNPGVVTFTATDGGGSGYVCRPWFVGNNEACPVAAPLAGYYRVRVYAYSSDGPVTGLNLTLTHP